MRQLGLLEKRDPRPSVGFTGTQRGMTAEQKTRVLFHLIADAQNGRRFTVARHGDCVGADSDFHHIICGRLQINDKIVIHPPEDPSRRAFMDRVLYRCKVEVLAPKPYIVRNHDIVDASDFVIATPGEREEQLRSGTWATIRYAKSRGTPLRIIYPDGTSEDSP
jgi:hypothetical protein